MRKFLFLIFCFVLVSGVGLCANAQNEIYSQDFIKAFQGCKPYIYSVGPVDILGMKVTSKKQIVGIKNGRCAYVEVVGPVNAKNIIRCSFNQAQLNRLVDDMKNNGQSVWFEYYNNPHVCRNQAPD